MNINASYALRISVAALLALQLGAACGSSEDGTPGGDTDASSPSRDAGSELPPTEAASLADGISAVIDGQADNHAPDDAALGADAPSLDVDEPLLDASAVDGDIVLPDVSASDALAPDAPVSDGPLPDAPPPDATDSSPKDARIEASLEGCGPGTKFCNSSCGLCQLPGSTCPH